VNVKIARLMGFFGVAAPVVGAVMLLLSIIYTPGWSLAENSLSGLGAEGFGAILFSSGLAMTGAVMMLFSTGLFELSKKAPVGQVGSAMYLAASLVIVGLALVTVNHQPYHGYLTAALFALVPLSMTVFSVHLWRMGLKLYSSLGFVDGVMAIGVILLGPVNAYSQLVFALAVSVWQAALGLWMLRLREPGEGL